MHIEDRSEQEVDGKGLKMLQVGDDKIRKIIMREAPSRGLQ